MSAKQARLGQVDVRLTLTDSEAMGLSQFLKRLRQDDVRARTSSQSEMACAIEGLSIVRRELARQGYDPR